MAATIITLNNDFYSKLPDFPQHVDVVALNDGNAHTYTVPTGVNVLYINPVDAAGANQPVFGRLTGTAAEPVSGASVTDGSASFPVVGPYMVKVPAGGSLSLIRAGASEVFVVIGCFSRRHVRP